MSYEGSEEYLCKNGHLWGGPSLYGSADPGLCPDCKTPIVWSHSIDDTNCDAWGIVLKEEWDKLLVSPAKVATCNLGHQHVVEASRYRQPTKEELKMMKRYWDSVTQSYKPCYPIDDSLRLKKSV